MTLQDDDPRYSIIKGVDFSKSRILLEPHIIFVCGGVVDITATEWKSLRNLFMNLAGGADTHADSFMLAENFKDWREGYKSLSKFEEDIAFISSLVVLFLESPGALVELGLFYSSGQIRKKLFVVVHNSYHDSDSFIKLGILAPLEEVSQELVRSYELDHENPSGIDEQAVKEVLDDVLNQVNNTPKTQAFSTDDRGHQIFFVYQMIKMSGALTFQEIEDLIAESELEVKKSEIKTALFILEKFGFVSKTKESSQFFYYASNQEMDRVDLHVEIQGEVRSVTELKIDLGQYYHQLAKSNVTFKRRLKVMNRQDSGEVQ